MNRIGMMATYPARWDSLLEMLPTVLGQLEQLYIYCNQYQRGRTDKLIRWIEDQNFECRVTLINSETENSDMQDMGKFWKLGDVEGYVFLLDDDLKYPADYCESHIKTINLHQCITTVHGREIKTCPLENYFADTLSHHYRNQLKEPKPVHIAGTGTVAFNTDYLPDSFRSNTVSMIWYKGMADIWFAMQVKSHELEIRCVPRPNGWLTDTRKSDEADTLYDKTLKDNSRHCSILNKYDWND